jgi:hypothetical protein
MDRQFPDAATFVSWTDLDVAIYRVNSWGREEGPQWVVKRTTEFFAGDTRKLGRERREKYV